MRLFNQCLEQREACTFNVDHEEVYILFSGGLRKEYFACLKSLSPETVIFVQVRPRSEPEFSKLRASEKKLEAFGPSVFIGRGVQAYHTSDGLLVSTFRGRILQFVYLPETSIGPPCASFYAEPEPFLQTFAVHPPASVSLDCPSQHPRDAILVLTANADVDTRRGPKWTVSAGTIKSGQYTHSVILDTTGLVRPAIEVSAEMVDAFGHAVIASCRVAISSN